LTSASPCPPPDAGPPAVPTDPAVPLDLALRRAWRDGLVQQGALPSEQWRNAVEQVPRHLFVERFQVRRDGVWVVHSLSDPDRRAQSLAAVYSDCALVTRLDPATDHPLCASPEPRVLARMLEQLDVEPSQRVLEIGTGTGYTTALLCRALGDHAVTSVDICPDTTAAALNALHGAGYHPTVLCADGSQGVAVHGPYHRILATCGVGRVPRSWVGQLTPGGTLVTGIGGLLAALRRTPNDSLCGRFVGLVELVPMRPHPNRSPTPGIGQVRDITDTATRRGVAHRTVTVPIGLDLTALNMFAGLVAEHGRLIAVPARPDVVASYRWWDPLSGSWACIDLTGPATASVRQYGALQFWQILADLLTHWDIVGRPPIDQYGITIAPTGQRTLWYRRPHRCITELP
jgi:protein-L-isoaspartate O-methyltransferase